MDMSNATYKTTGQRSLKRKKLATEKFINALNAALWIPRLFSRSISLLKSHCPAALSLFPILHTHSLTLTHKIQFPTKKLRNSNRISQMRQFLVIFKVILCIFVQFQLTRADDPYRYYTWVVTYGPISPLGTVQQVHRYIHTNI